MRKVFRATTAADDTRVRSVRTSELQVPGSHRLVQELIESDLGVVVLVYERAA